MTKGRNPEHRRPNALAVGRCPESGKAKFLTRCDAKDTARKNSSTARPFKCDHCGYWHLGGLYGRDRAWHRHIHGRD